MRRRRRMGAGTLAAWALVAAGGAYAVSRRKRVKQRIAGKVALVTGSSRGLGLILARELGRRGAKVVICARDEEELERAAASLRAEGIEALALPCDVTDLDGVLGLVAEAQEQLGQVDILVNNAGIIQVGPTEAMRLDDYRHAMDVMFFGALNAAEAVLPQMREVGAGTIVNITSIGANVAMPHLAPYTAAKFAMRGWSEAVGTEAAKHGVHVVTVVPGLMRTGSFGHALVKGKRYAEASVFALLASLPLVTTSGERAARRIVEAIERKDRFVVVGLPAKVLRLWHGLFPGTFIAAFGAVNRLLPTPSADAADQIALPGELFRRGLARSVLTALGDRAARRWNEEPA